MAPAPRTPLLHLSGIGKTYQSGDETIHALRDVSLTIHTGEFVAIMGQSGSGKSTLMNILGCLDRPSDGQYHIHGRAVETLTRDELATVRRTVFGFVFQRYNLITNADAAENVAMPAIYAGLDRAARFARAQHLLASLGLQGREGNRPAQLSGGQQQRVAIARALVNNPPVILADEPTGALDSRSGREVMQLLTRLHAEGRTIVLITHDEEVAAYAHRIIRIQDGAVISDEPTANVPLADTPLTAAIPSAYPSNHDENATDPAPEAATINLPEATRLSLRSLKANKFRTLLTLLGIIIGVTSVVTMMAVGNGSRANVISQISAMGTNLLYVRPGAPNIRSSGDIATLVPADADAIQQLNGIAAVSPERSGGYTLRYGNTDYATSVQGVGERMPELREWPVASGSFFTRRDLESYAPVIVLGQTVASNLFGTTDPVGQNILVRNVLFEVIGVLASKGATMMGNDQDDAAFIPVTTGLVRLFGGNYVNSISIKVTDSGQIDAAEDRIHSLLLSRHRTEDFSIRNMSSLLEMASATQATLTILLGTVAAISLLVGGIGVMNIMLVSVTERTREIGVRMATGARRKDVLFQFLTEAGVVCLLGGLAGVVLGLVLSAALAFAGVNILVTLWPSLLAFASAVATGILFGFIPARKAADMDPVRALSSE